MQLAKKGPETEDSIVWIARRFHTFSSGVKVRLNLAIALPKKRYPAVYVRLFAVEYGTQQRPGWASLQFVTESGDVLVGTYRLDPAWQDSPYRAWLRGDNWAMSKWDSA